MRRSLLLALGLTLGLTACDLAAVETAVDDFNIILGIESQSTVVGGLVVDAATGDLVESFVTLTYTPSVAGAVVDGFGDPVSGATVEGGTFNFAIANALAPSAGSKVTVAVSVQAEGYLPQRRVIALADTGAYGMTVALLSPARPPEGAATGSGAGSSSGASGTTARVIATSPTTEKGGSTTVDIAQGTVFSDATGQALSGDLAVGVTTISPGTPAFDTVPSFEDEEVAVAAFQVSAAVGGRSAAGTRTEVDISVTLPAGTRDPATGQPFAPGDRIDAIAFDADAGTWVAAGTGVVAERSESARQAATTIDGRFSTVGSTMAYSRSGVAAQQVTIRAERNGHTGALTARAVTASTTAEGLISSGQSSVTVEIPANADRQTTGIVVNGTFYAASSPTTCTDCVVSLPQASAPVLITLRPECPSPAERVYIDELPTYTVSVRERGMSEWYGAGRGEEITRRADGSLESVDIATTAIRAGTTYDVRATYLDDTYETVYSVPADGIIDQTFEAPSSLCQ